MAHKYIKVYAKVYTLVFQGLEWFSYIYKNIYCATLCTDASFHGITHKVSLVWSESYHK